MMLMQTVIGFISAIILNIVFEIFFAAGQLISSQIGLSMASQYDPRFGSVTHLTQFYIITATLIFFSINGHIFIIKSIVDSFQAIPIDQTIISRGMLFTILKYSQVIFNSSVLVSITLITTVLIINIGLAFITKFAPQFNIFSVGININLIAGLTAVYLTYQAFVNFASPEIQHGLSVLMHFFPKGH
jgi:flagellar biosynthetic protein FliR